MAPGALESPAEREEVWALNGTVQMGLREDSVLQDVWLDRSWWSWQQGEEPHD